MVSSSSTVSRFFVHHRPVPYYRRNHLAFECLNFEQFRFHLLWYILYTTLCIMTTRHHYHLHDKKQNTAKGQTAHQEKFY